MHDFAFHIVYIEKKNLLFHLKMVCDLIHHRCVDWEELNTWWTF